MFPFFLNSGYIQWGVPRHGLHLRHCLSVHLADLVHAAVTSLFFLIISCTPCQLPCINISLNSVFFPCHWFQRIVISWGHNHEIQLIWCKYSFLFLRDHCSFIKNWKSLYRIKNFRSFWRHALLLQGWNNEIASSFIMKFEDYWLQTTPT